MFRCDMIGKKNNMLRQFKNVFITGDMHLGDAHFIYEEKLTGILRSNKFDCIVFGGDTFDPWRGKSMQKLLIEYREFIQFLRALPAVKVFINGNHDRNLDILKQFGFEVRRHFKYLSSAGERVGVVHGDQFDTLVGHFEFLSKKVIYLEEKLNRLMKKFGRQNPFRLLQTFDTMDMLRTMNNFYRKILLWGQHVDTLVFGHLHMPWEGSRGKVNFYNWGSWQKDYGLKPRYVVNDVNGFRLCELD